jgi:hypothetical protein
MPAKRGVVYLEPGTVEVQQVPPLTCVISESRGSSA